MVLQMHPPVEDTIQSAQTEATAPEKMPVLPQTRAEAVEVGRMKLRTPRLMDRGNWLLLVISGAVLTAMLVIGMVFSSLNGIAQPATTGTSSANSADNMGSMGSSSTSSAPAPSVPHTTYNAALPAVPAGDNVDVKLVMKEQLVTIASGITYHAWTFNGTVPGPIIHVRQGQMVHVTLVNEGSMAHSIDFHAAQTPWNVNYQSVEPGKSFSFSWRANFPGVFMYHCGTPTVIYHMANGMYGTIIVDPANGWGAPAQEYALVQSEFYTASNPDGTYSVDSNKMMSGIPDYVVFNGYVNQYEDAPLMAKAGQKIRLFILNAGPTQFSAFHVIGAIFSDTYIDGNPANHMVGNQTVTIPPGGGVMVELTMPESGLYPFVTHAFANASKGAVGVLKVTP
ncbi:MAG TPA: multicopper oxidase domain-containing protein [Ktedonosporobacter sp.]|jgi:nitrite reductase (NO-forming)|nr:multicopper oxidase domain-containing protein [Ktedonosporobacter sp.]